MDADETFLGPAHAVYFGTYEIVKEMAGGNVDDGHHPLAAGRRLVPHFISWCRVTNVEIQL
jgi:hypothetical protein